MIATEQLAKRPFVDKQRNLLSSFELRHPSRLLPIRFLQLPDQIQSGQPTRPSLELLAYIIITFHVNML